MKSPEKMTRKEFEDMKYYHGPCKKITCNSVIILPASDDEELHDSGYRFMSFIALGSRGEIIGKFGGSADVINIEGIGGYGYMWVYKSSKIPEAIHVAGWSIDCLPKSGLLRIFCNYPITFTSMPISNFEIYSRRENV